MEIDGLNHINLSVKSLDAEDAKLKATCKDFEAIFIHFLIKCMRNTIPAGFIEKSFSREIHENFFDQELAKLMTWKGEGAIAKLLYEQMKKEK